VLRVVVVVGLVTAFASRASATVLLRFDFSTGFQPTEKNPSVGGPGINPFGVSAQVSSASPATAGAPFLVVDRGNLAATDFASAVSSQAFFAVGLNGIARQGQSPLVTMTSLDFDVTREGAAAPGGYGVVATLPYAPQVTATADLTTTRPNYTHVSIPLSGAVDADHPAVFDFYVYGPSAGSSIDFDNITINGTVATPEPGALGMLGLGGLALFGRRRQRARA
jgi:hypothetical protein